MEVEQNLYFKDHTLLIGYAARFWSRVLKGVWGIVLGALALVLLLSDIPALSYTGAALVGVWAYKIVFKKFRNKRGFKGGNLFPYTTYRTKKLIETAYDKSSIIGGSILLNIARELSDTYQVEALLHSWGVERSEFISKLEDLLREEAHLKETNKWKQARVEDLMVKAFKLQGDKHEPVTPLDVFKALPEMDSEKTKRLFGTFGVGNNNQALDQNNG